MEKEVRGEKRNIKREETDKGKKEDYYRYRRRNEKDEWGRERRGRKKGRR